MAKAKTDSNTILIEAPVATPEAGVYATRHLDLGALSTEQALALRSLFDGLLAARAQLKNGRFVAASADAVRYLLEQAHDALPH